jgi:hypothetical protein
VEAVTVPAGTFECYVIDGTVSFTLTGTDIETGEEVQMTSTLSGTTWVSEDVGIVKSTLDGSAIVTVFGVSKSSQIQSEGILIKYVADSI